jgi:hypothetical protein
MSNDLVTLLANNPALVATGLDEDTAAIAGGSRGGTKRISIKGGVFRKYVGGKEVGAIEDRSMNIIFVKMAHKPARSFYDKTYKEGERISPACWSSNSEKPDAEVKNPLAMDCSSCPKSVKGSGVNGGTACRLSWRTAVVLPNDPSGDVMQLVLPATSVFGSEDNGKYPFRAYVQHLAAHNVSAGRVITKMSFDTKSPTPKVMFSVAGAVPQEELPAIASQSKSPAAEASIKMTVFQTDEGGDSQREVAEVTEVAEPVKREEAFTGGEKAADVASVVKKWAKK